jgi:hypothetical protein
VFAVTAAVTVVLGYFAFQIRLNPDVHAILPETSAAMQFGRETGQTFATENIVLAAESPRPLEMDKLAAFARAIEAIEALPHVRGTMNPFNFVVFERQGTRVTPSLLGPSGRAPTTQEELETFRHRIATDPLTRGMVISDDLTTLACILVVDSLEDYGELLAQIRAAISDLRGHYTLHLAGSPPLIEASQLYLRRDVPRLLGGAIVVVLAVFFFGFRSKRSFLLPLLVVGLGTLWTTGIMSLLGINLSLVSLMVPPLVLILGSSYSIHVLTQYYRDADPEATDRSWIPASVTRIVQTVFLAAGTTVFGFLGLLTAEIRQIKEFGVSASIGIVLCAVLSLFFFPAVLSRLRSPLHSHRHRIENGPIPRFMQRLGQWVLRWRYALLALFLVICGGFALTIGTVRYDTNYVSYFRAREPAVEETRFVIRKLRGYLSVRITMSAPGGQPGYFLDPAVLSRVAALEAALARNPDVSYITSFPTYLRAYNEMLTGSRTIPESRAPVLALGRMITGAMATASGRELVGELVDDAFSRLTLVVRVYDSRRGNLMYEERLGAFAEEARRLAVGIVGEELQPIIWGPTMIGVDVSRQLARDQITSSLISAALILLLTSLSFRSVKYGLFTLVATTSGILLNFLVMAALSIPLDIVTVMFSSVSLGVGVDSSIHVIIQYRRREQSGRTPSEVLGESLRAAGPPILLTVASLVAGLLVLLASAFQPIARFGMLVSLAIVTTSAGSLVLLPAILAVDLTRSRRGRRVPRSAA